MKDCVISGKGLRSCVRNEYDSFMKNLKAQTNLLTFAESVETEPYDHFQLLKPRYGCPGLGSDREFKRIDKVYDSWEKLCNAFKSRTGFRLTIEIDQESETTMFVKRSGRRK